MEYMSKSDVQIQLPSVALVIIYNNNFEQNVEKIERIYRKRFPVLFHLMPGYDVKKHKENGTYRDNILPVYYDSVNFNGYVAQAKDILLDAGCDYYAFLADDVLLDPSLNHSNLASRLGLLGQPNEKTGYINELRIIDDVELIDWIYSMQSVCYMSHEKY